MASGTEDETIRASRRRFLTYAGAGLTILAAGGLATNLSGCNLPEAVRRASSGAGDQEDVDSGTPPDTEINLRAVRDDIEILPGKSTTVWRYVGEVVQGSKDASQPLPNSYLGPVLRFAQGERVRINFTNELNEPSIVHWHGLHAPESADGHPRLAIDPGETYTYDFTVLNRAGTYWYHPHPHGRTGPQVYYGLAGLMVITDQKESQLGLPGGEYDIPLVIQDRIFTESNQFAYLNQGMHARMMGFLGDRILVNGQPDFVLPVKTQPYRLRLLNGSNSRIYKLAWQDRRPLQVIATDGGLLESPMTRTYVTLAPGERIELWADFGGDPVGSQIALQSLSFADSGSFPVMQVAVQESGSSGQQLPKQLSTLAGYSTEDAVNLKHPRTIEMDIIRMTWQLNGRTFEMEEVASDEVVRLGDLEVWEFINQSPRMVLPHPMHIHNVQFQVISRQVMPQFADQYRTLADGFVDAGWKDTVLVMPGERVKILVRFEDYEGLYLYHCHNLEHEDMGMMRNFRIRA